jgi:hypothetical protein
VETPGGSGDECCECPRTVIRLVSAYCVAVRDPRLDVDNACTRAMRYAGCGGAAQVMGCVHHGNGTASPRCRACAQSEPYEAFQLAASVSGALPACARPRFWLGFTYGTPVPVKQYRGWGRPLSPAGEWGVFVS